MTTQPRLHVIYHSQGGTTLSLVTALQAGACQEPETLTKIYRATDAGLAELLSADLLVFAGPENFGSLSGLLKDFFDRTVYPAQAYAMAKPYALLVSAGNDGSGAVRQAQRILTG